MKILLPIDGSAASLDAVRQALRMIQDGLRASLVLANVQEPATLYEMLLAHDAEVIEQVSAKAGLHLLEPAQALVRAAGVDARDRGGVGRPGAHAHRHPRELRLRHGGHGRARHGHAAQRVARLGVARGAACGAGAGAHRQAGAGARSAWRWRWRGSRRVDSNRTAACHCRHEDDDEQVALSLRHADTGGATLAARLSDAARAASKRSRPGHRLATDAALHPGPPWH